MANAQHLALLRRGPRAWNEWCMDDPPDPDTRPDLRGADLTDAVLADPTLVDDDGDPTGVYLDDADLTGACLRGARLRRASFHDAALQSANLRAADLRSTGFGGADLRDADLRDADLRSTTMISTVLLRADLRGALFSRRTLFHGANLSQARLEGANLGRFASFDGARLRQAKLMGATLPQAKLSGADLTGANLAAADLTGAVLKNAQLTAATFDRADLTGADLTAANLCGASLQETNLTGALLYRANLTGADLAGADFTQATLTNAVFSGAIPPGAYADPQRRVYIGAPQGPSKRGRGSITSLAIRSLPQSLVDRLFRVTPKPEEVDAAVRGELWLMWQDRVAVYGLWTAAQAYYERAKVVGYVVQPYFPNLAVSGAFIWWCRASQHPYVSVWVSEEEGDALIAMSFRYVPAECWLTAEETHSALQVLKEYALPGGVDGPRVTRDGEFIATIAIDRAEEAAARLVALWRQRRRV